MELFKLLGTIAINSSEANKALDDVSSKGEKTQSKLSGAFSKIGKGAVAVGKTIATGLAAGGAAMGALTVKAMNLAGELEQNTGGAIAVFGELGERTIEMQVKTQMYDAELGKVVDKTTNLERVATTAYRNMGLSTSDFYATANKMGALFKGAGFETQDALNMSASAMQRAADVASIMGLDTESAMEAIAGAAKGNFTMMDNLGVAMNDTTLQAYAMSKGINKSTSEMTNQEKIALAMEMFMEKTAYAAGNYAKENETLAGSLGTAKAALTNFLDGSGNVEQLVTSFSNLANVIVKNLGELAPRLISGITECINQIMPMLPPLLQQILPVIIEGAVSLINGLVAAMPTIINAIMDALPALIDGVTQIINALIEALPQIMNALVQALPTLIPMLVDALIAIIVTLCTMLPEIIQPIIDYLPEIIVAVVNALLSNLPVLIKGIITLVGGIIKALPQVLQALWDALVMLITDWGGKIAEWLKPIWEGVKQWCSELWDSITQWFNNAVTSVSQWCSKIWEGAKSIFSTVADWINTKVVQPVINFFKKLWEDVKQVWDTICNVIQVAVMFIGEILSAAWQIITLPFRFIWENCKEYVFAVWEWIKEFVSTAINAVKNVITTVMNAIKDFFTTVWNAIKEVFTTVWTAIKDFLTPYLEALKTAITTAWNAIKSAIQTALNAIKSVVTTVWNAIKSVVTSVLNAVKSVVTKVWNAIKSAISTAVNAVKSVVTNVFNAVKNTVSNIFNSVKSTVTNIWNNIKSSISNVVNSIKSTVSSKFNEIKTKMLQPVEKARDTIKGIVDKIKGFFDGLKINLPKIKLPHFKITGEFSLDPPSVPKFSIEWYKKAMNAPMVLNDPTIFGYNPATGQMMGGGEAGSEVVSGLGSLLNMIRSAVAAENNTIAYYLQKIIVILADYFPQVIEALDVDITIDGDVTVAHLAPKINRQLAIIKKQEERGR